MQHNFQEAGWWVHYPEYFVSLMKAWYGDAATEENDYAFNYLPKVVEDHSDLAMFVTMKDGMMKGYFSMGQNPAAGGVNAGFHRAALEKLDWMVVRDLYEIETAAFWKRPGIDPTRIPTEVFFLPAASHVEKEGSFTNTQRLIQYRDQAVDSPDDARSENWFLLMDRPSVYNLPENPKLPQNNLVPGFVASLIAASFLTLTTAFSLLRRGK